MRPAFTSLAVAVLAALASCAGDGGAPDAADVARPFAVEVVSFTPGDNAGFGQDRLPDVVLGPPSAVAGAQGSTDVLSLGTGGAVVLRLGVTVVDGAGADLLVFENPFRVGGAPDGALFAEPGEVAVSADGEAFVTFPCDPAAATATDGGASGCAGYGVVRATDEESATDPLVAGGDAFDLADIGVAEASFVRIVDRATGGGVAGAPPGAGFDLDAVAAVHSGSAP